MNDFLRTTFREHEHLVEDTPDLLPGVRRRVGRSRRVRFTAVLAVAAVASSGAVLAHRTEVTTRPTVAKPPPGWRFESSLGAQIIVPENWSANRTACGQPLGPTVLRGHFATTACLTAFRLTPVAALVQARLPGSSGHFTLWARGPADSRELLGHPTAVDGIPAQRAEGTLSGGWFRGWVEIPARNVQLEVRTPDATTGRRILDSLRLVSTDARGCPTHVPTGAPSLRYAPSISPPDPVSISLCAYDGSFSGLEAGSTARIVLLQSSVSVTGTGARRLASALNGTEPGPNPDTDTCARSMTRKIPDLVILIHDRKGRTGTVFATYESCVGRGLDNGVRQAHITMRLMELLASKYRIVGMWSGDLPAR